jgi:hypothetical protein
MLTELVLTKPYLCGFRFPPRRRWKLHALFWTITQRVVLMSCRRFGTNYWSHLQESWPHNSVRDFHYSLRNIPEERSLLKLISYRRYTFRPKSKSRYKPKCIKNVWRYITKSLYCLQYWKGHFINCNNFTNYISEHVLVQACLILTFRYSWRFRLREQSVC